MANQSYIVVNADDFGMTQSITDGILRGHRDGIISSASILTTTAGFSYAAEKLGEYPGLGVGLHFTLSVGRPQSDQTTHALLTDSEGELKWRFMSLWLAMLRPRPDLLLGAIEAELDAQIQRALRAGITLDHINGERHIHLIPGVSGLVRAAARRYSIRYVRNLSNDVGFNYAKASDLPLCLVNGGLLKYVILHYMSFNSARASEQFADSLGAGYCSILFTGKMHQLLHRVWENPPEGITEIAVHPGLANVAEMSDIKDVGLQRYLRHADRQRELMQCIDLKSTATPAKIARFADL